MTQKDLKEIEEILRGILDCKTQAHRKLAIEMAVYLLKEKVTNVR